VLAKALVRARTAGMEQRQVEAGARKLQELMAVATAGPASASRAAPEFEYLTPMLVMPFAQFKRQGRIMKSVAKWRDEALREGWLVEYDKDSRKIVIFVSHTWWDRDFKDETNDPNDRYDKGAPDYQADYSPQKPQNLKWRVICAGVERLIAEQGLDEADVSLWLDWQSIYQDDKAKKLEGVRSLIKYATLCDYMLVPTDKEGLYGEAAYYPENIPGYGSRGWCRVEYFVFSLLAEMQGREGEVPLYAILRGGGLNQYQEVVVNGEGDMPSQGALSNPDDQALVRSIEDAMIEAFGKAIVAPKCRAGAGGVVDLSRKMLRACHVDALVAAVEECKVAGLDLTYNQLGNEGAEKLAAALRTNTTLTTLSLGSNKIGSAGGAAIAKALKVNTTLKLLDLIGNDLDGKAKQMVRAAVEGREGFELII